MATTAKSFNYAIDMDRTGRVAAEGDVAHEVAADWKPEHLLLAGLVRCTLTSLRYHARTIGIDDLLAAGSASGRVTQREEDGRYAFVEVECRLQVEIEPAPPTGELEELLAHAERDCFVGASLTAPPLYRWTVNREPIVLA